MNIRRVCLLIGLWLAAASAEPACLDRVIRVQLFGDSIVGGYTGRPLRPLSQGPTKMLQAAMDRQFGAGRVLVINRSMPGTASGDLRFGTDGFNKPWPRSVDADITLHNHGVNDMRGKVPINTYRDNLRAMTVTVLQTPTPVASMHAYASMEYAKAMRDVAVSPIADVDAYVRSLPNWESHFPDGVHPDQGMYELIVKNVIAPVVAAGVGLMLCRSAALHDVGNASSGTVIGRATPLVTR